MGKRIKRGLAQRGAAIRDPGKVAGKNKNTRKPDVKSESESEAAQTASQAGVGSLLRASRLRCGENLEDIAAMLRIRLPYLEAIEGGRFEDLPGGPYVIGFIRAYADHLGLDSDEVVRRYKEDTADSDNKAELDFPVPVPESGIPGGAVIFIGVAVALLAYGGWYVSTTENGFLAELVSPIPERLSGLAPESKSTGDAGAQSSPQSSPPAAETAAATPSEKPEMSEPDVTNQVTAAGNDAPEQDSASAHDAADAEKPATEPTEQPVKTEPPLDDATETAQAQEPAAPAATVEPSVAASTVPVETKPADATPTEPEQQAAEPQTAQPQTEAASEAPAQPQPEVTAAPANTETVPEAVPEAVQETVTAAPTATASAPTDASVGAVASAPAPAAVSKAGRIVVLAKANSWIQVRDDIGNQLVLTRLLRSGESYRVPDQPGLKLLTGNAGALEITVDGEPVPSIGPEGAVRRSVVLDVARLRDGTAVVE